MVRVPAAEGMEPAADRHTAAIFSTDAEWADHLVTFVRAGLERGEQVQYFADVTEPGQVMRTLMDRGVDAASAARRGQFVVTTAAETYLTGGRFDPDAMVELWRVAVESAASQGHRALRAIGEMSWAVRDIAGADRLLEYELRIHQEVFERLPLTASCFYDQRVVPHDALEVLAGAHLTRVGASSAAGPAPSIAVAPLPDRPGLRLSGSAGYESRRTVVSAAAVLAGSPTEQVTLDLSALDHLDIAALADIAQAAMRRLPARVHILGAPPALTRMLQFFPELASGLEVTGR
ncbi:MEDS domain-containing protein [Streptomyces lavendofoliae]|uniref:MEDS domain-containing protein n=1 Tax=Streptomyces lavendofoliae TaxID=67314 RepID=UPI003D94ACBB